MQQKTSHHSWHVDLFLLSSAFLVRDQAESPCTTNSRTECTYRLQRLPCSVSEHVETVLHVLHFLLGKRASAERNMHVLMLVFFAFPHHGWVILASEHTVNFTPDQTSTGLGAQGLWVMRQEAWSLSSCNNRQRARLNQMRSSLIFLTTFQVSSISCLH